MNVPTSLAAWTAALQALLPPGRAFTREPGSVLAKLLDGCAASFKGGQDTLDALALESDPRLALTMLPEWESLLGLPDACYEPLRQQLMPGVYDLTEADLLSFTRAGLAGYFNEQGLWTVAAAGVARFDHDLAQVLGEVASRNLVTRSNDFSNAVWTKNQCSIQTGAASKIVENTANGVHGPYQIVSGVLTKVYTSSYELKAGERNWACIQNTSGGSNSAFFNLAAGTIGTLVGAGTTATMTALGDGWYRCSVSSPPLSSTLLVTAPTTALADNVQFYLGDGVSGIYARRGQLEGLPLAPSTYIETASAPATRFATYASRGLLLEPAGVNFLAYASTPNVWNTFVEGTANGTVTVVADPIFGDVVRLTKTAGASVDRFGLYVVVAAGLSGDNFTISARAKYTVPGTVATPIYMDASRVGGGLVSSNALMSGAIDTWKLYENSAAGPLLGGGQFYCLLNGPIGSSIDFVMPQLELASSRSSWIANASAGTATRAADMATITVPRSLPERRAQAFQRLTEQGGQSRQYFIDMAATLGEPGCTISEFRPMTCNDNCNSALTSAADKFSWRVNIPHSNAGARPMHCNDNCNSPLDLGGVSVIECPIRERAPAHTNVFFAYAN